MNKYELGQRLLESVQAYHTSQDKIGIADLFPLIVNILHSEKTEEMQEQRRSYFAGELSPIQLFQNVGTILVK